MKNGKLLWIGILSAMHPMLHAQQDQAAARPMGLMDVLIMFVLPFIIIFYFFFIRPQKKKEKEKKEKEKKEKEKKEKEEKEEKERKKRFS